MKVSELLGRLQAMPPEAELVCLYDDGYAQAGIGRVALAEDGRVFLTAYEWVPGWTVLPQEARGRGDDDYECGS